MNNEKNNKADEVISDLLSGLPRIEAPPGFGKQVMARIAAGGPSATSPFWFLSSMKVAIPLLLMIFVGAYLFVQSPDTESEQGPLAAQSERSAELPSIESAAKEEEPFPADVDVSESRSDSVLPVEGSPAKESAFRRRIETGTRQARRAGPRTETNVPETANEGGSIDRTITRPPESMILTPDLDGAILDPREVPGFETVGEFKPADILRIMGIRAEFGENGWRVTSVDTLASGRRSRVLVDDIIEAIDGVPIGRDTVFKGKVTIRTLQIRRGDDVLTVAPGN
ncbi:MAG TPA: hypothetical protein PKD24_13285 [Pyrinomonadaceae bacterium]|nr:hypothetical protein [Pyrinomonadaceae bacterium]HMP66341.1 hypothetical protein [Pyrinomonadaceae bacterium]